MIKNIIFDFDGVIVDSEIIVARSFSFCLGKRDIDFHERDFFKFAGKKTVQIISELSNIHNIIDKDHLFKEIMLHAMEIFNKDLQPVIGVKKFLKNIDQRKFIGSNSLKDRIIFGLKKVGLSNHFKDEAISSFDLVKKPKPEPDIYERVINLFNLRKNETVIIEDSVTGVKSGTAAGIKVIGLTAGKHWHQGRSEEELIQAGAFEVLGNYEDVLKIINKL